MGMDKTARHHFVPPLGFWSPSRYVGPDRSGLGTIPADNSRAFVRRQNMMPCDRHAGQNIGLLQPRHSRWLAGRLCSGASDIFGLACSGYPVKIFWDSTSGMAVTCQSHPWDWQIVPRSPRTGSTAPFCARKIDDRGITLRRLHHHYAKGTPLLSTIQVPMPAGGGVTTSTSAKASDAMAHDDAFFHRSILVSSTTDAHFHLSVQPSVCHSKSTVFT